MLGSAGRDLFRQSSETLAGRIAYHELTPFRTAETGPDSMERPWVRGGFPPLFLAPDDTASVRWRNAFIRTFNTYLDALADALVVRRLSPWCENLKKRQVKAPKVYVTDTGLLHALLALDSESALLGHPKAGASWL